MKRKNVSLTDMDDKQIERVVARLEGEVDEKTAKLWNEEFSASGGKVLPPAPPTVSTS